MLPSRNPVSKTHPEWTGTAPMRWKLAFAGAIVLVLAGAAVL